MSESFNLDRAISIAINSGKTDFGVKKALSALEMGNPKALILSSNCPDEKILNYNAKLANVMTIIYPKNSIELGATCGRPHKVSVLTIHDPGDSNILRKNELETDKSDEKPRRGRRKKKKKR
ncbi:MAG: 50S ribosomal protein L30e [Candidatus Hodarchaeales archaeon]